MKLEFFRKKLRRTEQPSWTSLSKQSKTKKKNFPGELESMKLEFHWKKQSNPIGPLGVNRAKQRNK